MMRQRALILAGLLALLLAASARAVVTGSFRAHVPRAAQVLTISWKNSARKSIVVTNVRLVGKVARLINAHRVERQWVTCSEGYYPPGIFLSFRHSIHGRALVTVAGVVNGAPGAACEPTEYLVRGRLKGWFGEDTDLLHRASRILHRRLD
jgi:hypothetical protein